MNKVYIPVPLEGFELCQPKRQEDFETIAGLLDGSPRERFWMPVPVRLIHNGEGAVLAPSDSPWLGSHALVFREAVIETGLGKLFGYFGEFLALECDEARLVVYNARQILSGALDVEASSSMRFSSGRVMRVMRYVFRADEISEGDIFKITNLRVSPTFVSERVVQAWNSSGFRGLDFKLVWSA